MVLCRKANQDFSLLEIIQHQYSFHVKEDIWRIFHSFFVIVMLVWITKMSFYNYLSLSIPKSRIYWILSKIKTMHSSSPSWRYLNNISDLLIIIRESLGTFLFFFSSLSLHPYGGKVTIEELIISLNSW